MSKIKSIIGCIVFAVAFSVALSSASFAQDKAQKDINDFTCKDIVRFSGDHRDIALAFMHGYLLGKKGTSLYRSEKLGDASDRFIEYCLDNPTVKALTAMDKAVK